ncbi:MAG: LysR family transcriptional regulator [Acidobacteria bacterium]|nr:MAG: LysR family transcriptional regulator [Acidobacteriota bacterium]
MDLADLETLLTVARERSFSRAAEKLHRTQPAISQAVQRLEHDCGEILIDRASRRARLTPAGELVVQRAEQMLRERLRLQHELSELRGLHRGKVTVGANESTAFFLLPIVAAYRARWPEVKVEIRRSLSRTIPAEVLAGNLDLGVIAYDPELRELSAEVVYHDRLAFIVYPRHPLAQAAKPVPLKRLASESFIAHNVESPYRDFTVSTFRRGQVPLNIAVEMPTIESIKHLVARGLGVAFVPRISVEQELRAGALREVSIRQFKVERPLRLVAPRHGRLSHAAAAFASLARRAPPNLPSANCKLLTVNC